MLIKVLPSNKNLTLRDIHTEYTVCPFSTNPTMTPFFHPPPPTNMPAPLPSFTTLKCCRVSQAGKYFLWLEDTDEDESKTLCLPSKFPSLQVSLQQLRLWLSGGGHNRACAWLFACSSLLSSKIKELNLSYCREQHVEELYRKNCVACVQVEDKRLTRFSIPSVTLHLYYTGARRIYQSVWFSRSFLTYPKACRCQLLEPTHCIFFAF